MWKIDSGSESGVTSAVYSHFLDWYCSELGKKTILLKNSDSSNSLKYKLLGRAAKSGIAKELVGETELLAGGIAEFHYDEQWHQLIVQVIDGSGHANCEVDYEGQGA
jgi:hypothetical protein